MSNEIQKATRVQFIETNEFGWHIFRGVSDGTRICVTKVEDGIISVLPPLGSNIADIAKTIAGCFNKDSNFSKMVWEKYNLDENVPFNGIKLKSNDIIINVSSENANAYRIAREWLKQHLIHNKHLEREAWYETPTGKAYLDMQLGEYQLSHIIDPTIV